MKRYKLEPIPDLTAQLNKNVKRLPVILCEDISASMASKCELMNKVMSQFFEIKSREPLVCTRTNISVIKFNNKIYESKETRLSEYEFRKFSDDDFTGTTHLWGALDKAVKLSKKYFDNAGYWTPIILLYTDGFPNDEHKDLKSKVIAKLQNHEKQRDILLFILGIGDEAGDVQELNPDVLNRISIYRDKSVLYAYKQEMDTYRFFQFVMRTITNTITYTPFIVEKNGQYKMPPEAIDELYHLYSEQQKEIILEK